MQTLLLMVLLLLLPDAWSGQIGRRNTDVGIRKVLEGEASFSCQCPESVRGMRVSSLLGALLVLLCCSAGALGAGLVISPSPADTTITLMHSPNYIHKTNLPV